MSLLSLFCDVDDFCQSFSQYLAEQGLGPGNGKRGPKPVLSRNMKNRLMPLMDKLLVRKRAIIETINDQLKNISQIQHTRHRSPINFLVNLVAGLIAYTHQTKKPSLNWSQGDMELLPAIT